MNLEPHLRSGQGAVPQDEVCVIEKVRTAANEESSLPRSRRSRSRHCRHRRNRRSAEGNHRRPRAPHPAGAGAAARGGGQRRQAAGRDRLARYRQFPELALSRSGNPACQPARHRPRARLLRPGRRREPDPLPARGCPAHRARRMQRRRGLRRRSAIHRHQGRTRRRRTAVDAVRPRRAGTETRRGVPETDGGEARRVPAGDGLSDLRGRHLGALGPDSARGDGGIRRIMVALFAGRRAKSQCLAETPFHARGNHDADRGQPLDRVALHQTPGRQSDRQHGRGIADDQPCEGARCRDPGGPSDSRLGRGVGGGAARLPAPRPVFPEPSAKCRAEGGAGSRRRRWQGVRRHRTL